MRYLIDTLDGRTIEVNFQDSRTLYPYRTGDLIYVNGESCRMSTARSLEAEAIKKAAELFRDVMKRNDIADGAESIDAWLEQWDSK